MTNSTSERDQVERLVAAVLKSPKYTNVCEDLIRNIGGREFAKGQNLKVALKATKNKLHQIGGAYFLRKPNYALWLTKLTEAKNLGDQRLLKETCTEIMNYHHSTKERLKILDQFYMRIFSFLPHVKSIIDLACGLNPLSIPWMPITAQVKYYAYDIYKDMIDFLNSFMAIYKVQGFAEVRDVTQKAPVADADVAFMLNTIPCLEQIEKHVGLRILESINSNFLVVSFPVKSLCGREKNMRTYYEASFNKLTREKSWTIRKLEFRTELVFLIIK